MKRVGAISAAFVLCVLLGAAGPGYAQQDQQPRHNSRRAQPRPSARSPRVQQRRTAPQQRAQEVEQQRTWPQLRARNWKAEPRTWQERGGYTGQLIPATYFGSHYGPNHWFRVYSLPFTYVSGYPRFQDGGYWFSVVDPIPEYLDNNWSGTTTCTSSTTAAGTTCMTAGIPVDPALPSLSCSRLSGFVAPGTGGRDCTRVQHDKTSQVLDLRRYLGAHRG